MLNRRMPPLASTSFDDSPMSSNPELPPSPGISRANLNEATHEQEDGEQRGDGEGRVTLPESSPDHDTSSPETRRKRKHAGFMVYTSKKFGMYNPSLILENSGSVARDHLASERTFLAYVRTSLTIASAGIGAPRYVIPRFIYTDGPRAIFHIIALFQLFALSNTTSNASIHRYSRPMGATVVALGIVVLVLGVARYFSIQVALVKGEFPVARVSPALLAFALLAVVFVVFGILLGVRNDS